MINIKKEELKKKAISGAKSVIIGAVIKTVTNPKNRKRVCDYLLDKTSSSLYYTENKQRYEYSRSIMWLNDLRNKHLSNNISIVENSYGINTSIKNGTYTIIHNKCVIMVEAHNLGGDSDDSITLYKQIKINIIGKNAKDLYKEALKEIKFNSDDNYIEISKRTGPPRYIQKRKLDTIFSDQFDEINDLIVKWKSQQDIFMEHGICFKTGILLYGKPGTGKTSIVKAIATEFNMNIVYINLATIKPEDIEYINIPENCIVLLEEIDLIKDENDPEYKKKISSVLNILDGTISPSKCIIIATSNYKDQIDERILRKGRFDNAIEVTDICRATAARMCKSFKLNPDDILKEGIDMFNPSDLQAEIFKLI